MTSETPSDRRRPAASADTREARLKAALKANLGRRKAQARARTDGDVAAAPDHRDETQDGPDTAATRDS